MSEFLAMGGYAFYVWTSWGLAALAMAVLTVASLRAHRQREAQLKVLQETATGGRRRRPAGGAEVDR